jgi:hypothetical protein
MCDVKLHANDWTFLKLSAVEREINNIFLWNFKFDDRKHQIHPILFPRQSLYASPNHLSIICQNLIIWKLLLSIRFFFKYLFVIKFSKYYLNCNFEKCGATFTGLFSVCKSQSFVNHLSKSHNLKASPFRAIWSFERHDNCKMLLACFLRVLHIPPSLVFSKTCSRSKKKIYIWFCIEQLSFF